MSGGTKPKIFLVVRYNRHVDDRYTAHFKLESAKKEADEFMQGYPYKWEERQVPSWLYYHHTDNDDGPTVHIQELGVS